MSVAAAGSDTQPKQGTNRFAPRVRRALAGRLCGGYHEGTDSKEDLCLERRFAHFCSLFSLPFRPAAQSP
jgi:hypothetical protein